MIDDSIRIRLNQFILAYERQCAELEFQRQNIKQNVMLSIIEKRNNDKKNIQQLERSVIRPQIKGANLASSKQTKFSEERQAQNNKDFEVIDRNSRLMQRSNVTAKSNRSALLINNNYVNGDNNFANEDENSGNNADLTYDMKNKSNIKNRAIEVSDITESNKGNINDDKAITFSNSNNSVIKGLANNLKKQQDTSLIGNRSRAKVEKRLQEAYSGDIDKNNSIKSRVFGRGNQSNLVVENKSILRRQPESNPSIFVSNQEEQEQQQFENADQRQEESQQYPTFQKPSFKFITDMNDLRGSSEYNDKNQQQQQEPNDVEQQEDQRKYRKEDEEKSEYRNYGKWGSRKRQDYRQQQQGYEEEQPSQQYHQGQNHTFEPQEQEIQYSEQTISNLQQDQSMMLASQLNRITPSAVQQERRSYAFEINMEKSNIPSQQNLQELKKKKILQLERKRLQRMENNSRKKQQNLSQLSNNSKEKPNRSNLPRNDNRDSLNKSINNDKKNQRKPNGSRISVNPSYNMREDQNSGKDSVFQDNRTIMSKYTNEDTKSNIRSISPLNTVKTIHTDKRPPLSKNRRQQNIFAGESNAFQRQKSVQKVTQDPKIVPIDRKNSFQKKSNIKLMINAITYTCLPGQLNRRQREKLIDVLQDNQAQYFILLFKQYSRKIIKGIYIMDSGQQKITKIYGQKSPNEIYVDQVQEFYRFDSGSRQFRKIDGCKTFSFSVQAIDLK